MRWRSRWGQCRFYLKVLEDFFSNCLDLAVVRSRLRAYEQLQRHSQARATSVDQVIPQHPVRTIHVNGQPRVLSPWADTYDLILMLRALRLFTLGNMLRRFSKLTRWEKEKCQNLWDSVSWPQGDWGEAIETVIHHYYMAVSPMIVFQGFRSADLQPPITAFDDQADLRADHLYDSDCKAP